MTQNTIELGKGFGPLRFGHGIDMSQEIFGPANERVEYEDGDVHLRYWQRGVYLFFPAVNGNVLEGIEVERRSGAILLGALPFELDRPSIIELLKSHYDTLMPGDFAVRRNEDGEIELYVPRLLVSFFFEDNNTVSSVNWSDLNNSGVGKHFTTA